MTVRGSLKEALGAAEPTQVHVCPDTLGALFRELRHSGLANLQPLWQIKWTSLSATRTSSPTGSTKLIDVPIQLQEPYSRF